MKKQLCVWLTVISMGLGSAAMADNEWGVFGSFWAPSDGDNGFGGGIKIGAEMVDRVQLDLRYSVVNNVVDSGAANVDVQPLEFGLSFAVPVSDVVEPYLGVGLGYYFFDGEPAIDDEWGFYTSAGLEFQLSRSGAQYGETTTKLFVEAMYRVLDTDDVDLSGLGMQAGLLIGW